MSRTCTRRTDPTRRTAARERRSLPAALLGFGLTAVLAVLPGAAHAAPAPGTFGVQETVLTYSTDYAPGYQAEIAESVGYWNASTTAVTLVEGVGTTDVRFVEIWGATADRSGAGSLPGGDVASVDVPLYTNLEYARTRHVSHEIGHLYGLPNDYSKPCSFVMSGGGPGPGSCTNAVPNANEAAAVDALWGIASRPARH